MATSRDTNITINAGPTEAEILALHKTAKPFPPGAEEIAQKSLEAGLKFCRPTDLRDLLKPDSN